MNRRKVRKIIAKSSVLEVSVEGRCLRALRDLRAPRDRAARPPTTKLCTGEPVARPLCVEGLCRRSTPPSLALFMTPARFSTLFTRSPQICLAICWLRAIRQQPFCSR